MRKIISLFQRNYETDRKVRDEIVTGAEWVVAGEGIATRKFDGTCCMVRDGKLYKRYDAKRGKTPPPNFEPAQDYDEVTGHMPGWLPVGDGPEDKWHREGWEAARNPDTGVVALPNGTYELCGHKIGSDGKNPNPERIPVGHVLIPHGQFNLLDAPRTYNALRDYLFARPEMEGIVWHHADGRMVKIKRKDFPVAKEAVNG